MLPFFMTVTESQPLRGKKTAEIYLLPVIENGLTFLLCRQLQLPTSEFTLMAHYTAITTTASCHNLK